MKKLGYIFIIIFNVILIKYFTGNYKINYNLKDDIIIEQVNENNTYITIKLKNNTYSFRKGNLLLISLRASAWSPSVSIIFFE